MHQETCPNLDRTLSMIRAEGAKAGVVLNPATPVALLEDVLEIVDYVLIMSVNPGFGGQQFIPRTLEKIRKLDRMRETRRLDFAIEIDGGVTLENLPEIVQAGCDWLVAGSSVFHAPDPASAVAAMQRAAASSVPVRV